MPTSRFRRPARPAARLDLQGRDVDVLRAVSRHRFAQAEHLHDLAFPGRALRVVQMRLRKLWEHGLLDRHFVPFTLDGTRRPPSVALTPTYSLGMRGIDILSRATGLPRSVFGPGPGENQLAPPTLAHHLVVTDLLASLEVACRANSAPALIEIAHEWDLWQRLRAANVSADGFLIPDGAFTLRYPSREHAETWYVEVVRASVSGGNETFKKKMLRYVELHRAGAFKKAFGDTHVRGVLVATPTAERAANLRALTAFVPGRRFFAFTQFEEERSGKTLKRFRPSTVLSLDWTDGVGDLVRLGDGRSASG